MALVFRWYLGLSSRWANAGEPGRQLDYQVWCGPAMGAFNEWVKGTPLEATANRTVVGVASTSFMVHVWKSGGKPSARRVCIWRTNVSQADHSRAKKSRSDWGEKTGIRCRVRSTRIFEENAFDRQSVRAENW